MVTLMVVPSSLVVLRRGDVRVSSGGTQVLISLGTQLLVWVLSIYPPSEGMDIPGMSMAARAAAGITIKGRIMS